MGGTTSKEHGEGNTTPQDLSKQSIQARFETPEKVKGADYSKPLPRERLPPHLQEIVDNEENLWDEIKSGKGQESTETNVRYAAYATRIRTILLSAHRYVAYTSDIGESFRPVAHPYLVRGAYGVSWAYLAGDVAHEGYKAYIRQQAVSQPHAISSSSTSPSSISTGVDTKNNSDSEPAGLMIVKDGQQLQKGQIPAIEDYRAVMAQRAVFQGLASMGLPAFTIHSIVRYSGRAMKDLKNTRIRTWGPIGLGLAAVPFLPYMFDEPVERAVEWTFHKGFEAFGGPGAVGHAPKTGREDKLNAETWKTKEKEL